MKRISDILKAKNEDLSVLQEQVKVKSNNYNLYEQSTQKFGVEDFPYLDVTIKRRAQTIGLAFDIAFTLLVALKHSPETFNEYINRDNLGINNEKTLAEVEAILKNHLAVTNPKIFTEIIVKVKALSTNTEPTHLGTLSSYAVTLAWYVAYIMSGYFPADVSVMNIENPVHNILTKEVEQILSVADRDFINQYVKADSKLILKPNFSDDRTDIEIESTGSFIVDNTLYSFSTTESPEKNINKSLQELYSQYLLNKGFFGNDEPKFNIEALSVYMVRHNQLTTIDLTKEVKSE